ncbi:hypothetical protein E4U21_001240 [Claviceps maximensis]|nr:hypothetical protein E4U21_001240 [Claviceps maximensis]
MLSHLRFHRRGASTPSSPVPEQQSSFSPLGTNEQSHALDFALPHDANSTSATSSHAPLLPSIAGVVSSESDLRRERRKTAGLISECRPQQAQRLSYIGDSGFIGGAALQNYRRDVEAQQISTKIDDVDRANNNHFEDNSRIQNHIIQDTATEFSPNLQNSQMKKVMSFSTPTDLQGSQSFTLGRRPAGARLPAEPPMLMSNPPAATGVETQRVKKGIPFLKNPMSTLLMRRKNNQSVPDVRPLPMKKDEEPAYDPRIRGTRIHDFSAPRKSREAHTTSYSTNHVTVDTSSTTRHQTLPASSSHYTNVSPREQNGVLQLLDGSAESQSPGIVKNISQNTSSSSVYSSCDQEPPVAVGGTSRSLPEKKCAKPGRKTSAEAAHKSITTKNRPPSSSVRSTRSKNASFSDMAISAIPKHMKSTSSRFSFDMAGAAKQEKLLEERHRQRELERKTTRHDSIRDSSFDEFDEDAFDYDAMMDDDGLEERIPGVNADFEDEQFPGFDCADIEADPDNDQENFAGFVFQRSSPVSTLTSHPGSEMVLTSRDADGNADGNAIGAAISNNTVEDSNILFSAQVHVLNQMDHGKESFPQLDTHESSTNALSQLNIEEDLYYDDGMIGLEEEEEDVITGNNMALLEKNAQPFDESIFDDDDTDQFGRPVPGAFQHAQSLRRAAQQPSLDRASDSTSRLSAPSTVLRCTTHTSLSADGVVHERDPTLLEDTGDTNRVQVGQALDGGTESIVAYQAALAAAAHRAAASGKFQRSSSPSSISCHLEDDHVPTIDDNDDDDDDDDADDDDDDDEEEKKPHGFDDMDNDFDLGDDDIIAEANASALANDSDGWYGQEFGFYSAPPSAHATSHAAGTMSLQDYEYANGGFFGPGGTHGIHRSISGRLISREPNLTPITEKSEYSNRNSFMSLGYPPISTSTPAVQSPGLAQLAMLGDSRDDMTLSALLRLRNRAWGGSQASLVSSREGSPRSDRAENANLSWPANPLEVVDGQLNHVHNGRPSTGLANSYGDEQSNDGGASASPTMTTATAGFNQGQQSSAVNKDTT